MQEDLIEHPFLESLEKKIRNLNKKLKEIKELQDRHNQGSEVKAEQLEKIKSKDNVLE